MTCPRKPGELFAHFEEALDIGSALLGDLFHRDVADIGVYQDFRALNALGEFACIFYRDEPIFVAPENERRCLDRSELLGNIFVVWRQAEADARRTAVAVV